MKKASVFVLAALIYGSIFGQFLIIDDPDLGGDNIPFQDTVLFIPVGWGNGDSTLYYIDLDQDTINDVKFRLYGTTGSTFHVKQISISAFNGFAVHIDTCYLDSSYYQFPDSTILIDIDTVTFVRKYNTGDTISNNHPSTSMRTNMLLWSWAYTGWPDYIGHTVGHFASDTSYIAFSKINGQSSSIYYLKVFMEETPIGYPPPNFLFLLSAKTNDDILYGIKGNSKSTNMIYPNPVSDNIYLKGKYDYFEIHTLQGTLVRAGIINENQNVLDVSGIRKGYYILSLRHENTKYTTKFIKL